MMHSLPHLKISPLAALLSFSALLPVLPGQTLIDLRTQTKRVDFAGALATRPFKTGTSLPSACSAGEAFFKTDAPAGQNLFGCTAANIWTLQSGGSAGGTPNYGVSFDGAVAIVIPGSAHQVPTSNLLVTCYDTGTPAQVVEPDKVTVDPQSFDVQVLFAVPQSGHCVVNGTRFTADSGASATAGSASNAAVAAGTVTSGAGLLSIVGPQGTQISVNTAVVPTFLTGTAILSFPPLAAGACASELPIVLNGAVAGDSVAPGWPSLPEGVWGLMRVSDADTVGVRLCNLSSASITLASAVFRATVVRSF